MIGDGKRLSFPGQFSNEHSVAAGERYIVTAREVRLFVLMDRGRETGQ